MLVAVWWWSENSTERKSEKEILIHTKEKRIEKMSAVLLPFFFTLSLSPTIYLSVFHLLLYTIDA